MRLPSGWRYIQKGLVAILGVLVLAILASIIFLTLTLNRLDHLIAESSRSSASARQLQSLLLELVNVESGARGYLLTDNNAYLQPYTDGIKQIPQTLQTLQPSADNQITASEYQQLQTLTNQRLQILKDAIATKQQGNDVVISGRGKMVMDQLRGLINQLTERNTATIATRQRQSHDSVRNAFIVAIAVSVFLVGICAVIIRYFQTAILRERALENTKSEFLSLASHQLRTPATNVKQYLGLLIDGYLGDLTKEQTDALQVAYKNNELEIRIMNDLLDVAKLDLKRIQLRKKPVNLVPLVRQVVKDFAASAEAKSQTLSIKAPREVIANVDRDYMKGAIEKLVDNAVRYSKHKTNISVKVRIDAELGAFEIVVKDQGLGIQKRELPKLFMKFSRLANEFSANSEGSGNGLYWVKQVIALHGGTIDVVSKEGYGSKFTVRAPID